MIVDRSPKYLQLAREIEADIRSDRWADGRMPGVRLLARECGVSVVTASRALQELSDRGLIDTVERSGCFIRPAAAVGGESWALCQRLTAGPWRQATEGIIRDGFEAAARLRGGKVRCDLFAPADDTPEPDLLRQVRATREAGVEGLFYLPSRISDAAARQDEAALRACRDVGLPVVLVERNLRGDRPLPTDLVGYDDLEAGRAITRHLLDTGRRRPAYVVGSPTSSHAARLAGYLLALSGTGTAPLVLEQPADVPLKDAYAWLTDRLLTAGADAVACYQDYTAVGLILELLHRGKRVPTDVAVAGFEDLPIGNTFALGVTTYSFPCEELARRGMQLMRERIASPDAPAVKVAVPGRLVVRESTTGRGA